MGLFDLFKKKPKQETETIQLPPNVKLAPGAQLPPGVVIATDGKGPKLSSDDLRKTAMLHYQLGDKYEQDGDMTHASRYYLHAVENIRDLAEKEKKPGDLALLYRCYAHLGVVSRAMNDKTQAAKYWERAFEVNRMLIAVEPEDSQHYSAAGISSTWAGFNYREAGNNGNAARCYRAGLEVIRAAEQKYSQFFVHADPDGRRFGSFRAEACLCLAEIGGGDTSEPLRLANECIQALTQLYELDTTEDRLYDLTNGVFLCALTLRGADRKKYLGLASDLCEGALGQAENRMRFMRLKKQIEQEG